MKKLPIGIQTFRKIIEKDYLYIDKTKEAYELITNYPYAFLSRPRRFGKSLLISTIKEICYLKGYIYMISGIGKINIQ